MSIVFAVCLRAVFVMSCVVSVMFCVVSVMFCFAEFRKTFYRTLLGFVCRNDPGTEKVVLVPPY